MDQETKNKTVDSNYDKPSAAIISKETQHVLYTMMGLCLQNRKDDVEEYNKEEWDKISTLQGTASEGQNTVAEIINNFYKNTSSTKE